MSEKPIRIAHVIGKLNAAGVEAAVNNYYRHIDHNKYQFDYFVDSDGECDPPQDIIDMGARYYVIPPYQKLFQHINTLTKLFGENEYKIVHSGMNTLAPISMYCAWRAGVPIRINHNHSTAGRGETKKNILKYLLRPFSKCFSTHYAACSKYAGEWLFGKKMVEDGEVTIFYNAIKVEDYTFDSNVRDQVRKELKIDDKFVIGHVGRFCYQKNQEFLIDVFRKVHDINPSSVLLLVGIGEQQKQIIEKVKELSLTGSVLFLGARKDVNRLYQAMDCFAFPSRYEGLGMVAVEAQCSGLQVIASKSVPLDAMVSDHIRFIDFDIDSWVRAINSLGIYDRNIQIDEKYNIKIEAKKMEDFYSEALKHV